MRELKNLNFEAHAHIKDIIGQDMINDDNIAIKELVKNGIDADATKVNLSFSYQGKKVFEIMVQDNGIGMSVDDIKQKWLNMGYSSKKSDDSRSYAGSKGIGRFSADRLGQKLYLYTKKKNANEIIKIVIDWKKFEDEFDWGEKIDKIKFQGSLIAEKDFQAETGIKKISHGTVLKIQKPRYSWEEGKLIRLKKDLEKLMIPKQVEGGDKFNLFINVSGLDALKDKTLSGKIENKVFDNLPFKTSYIKSFIGEDGKTITTELYHRGDILFQLVEKNKYTELKNAKMIIFHLNRYHKAFFKKQTAMDSVAYGSIFLYLNGFRVPPYGDEANDWLGVDRRLGQGYRRYLGLRDILGRIELTDYRGKNYQVASDREGLKHNLAFSQLRDIRSGYFGHAFKILEKFVVEGLSWDRANEPPQEIENRVKNYSANFDDFKTDYLNTDNEKEKTIASFLNSAILKGIEKDNIIALNAGESFYEILGRHEEDSAQNIIDKLNSVKEKINPSDIKMLEKAQVKIGKQEKEINNLKKESVEVSQKLKVSEKRRIFAEAHMIPENEKLEDIIHLTGLWGGAIRHNLNKALSFFPKDNKNKSLKKAVKRIKTSQFIITKIIKLSRIITKAKFELLSEETDLDIVAFIYEYVNDIKEFGPHLAKLKINVARLNEASFFLDMSAVELSMLIDNIILNAGKNRAKNLHIYTVEGKNSIRIIFEDDGNGLTDKYKPKDLFEAGITTTSGSGMGLYQVREVAKNLGAKIVIKNNVDKGASVILELKK